MFSYFAYGLGIHSTLPLPEFLPAEVGCDVFVRLKNGNGALPWSFNKSWHLAASGDEAVLSHPKVGAFSVRVGREITAAPAHGTDERLLGLFIETTVMAVLLHQRGLLVLHASAAEVDGCAVAFAGMRGMGKSSLAAAMHARGHGVIADDLTAVDLSAGPPVAVPAFPLLKLFPEAAASLGYGTGSLLFIHALEEKRGCRVIDGFGRDPLPLRRVYVLDEDAARDFEAVRPQDTVIELLRHTFLAPLLRGQQASLLQHCACLAKGVTVYRLRRSPSLGSLSALARLVEEHVRQGALPDSR